MSPIANNLLTLEQLTLPEAFFPLHARTCDNCGLVQLPEISTKEFLFPQNYTYHSSYSESWLLHSQQFAANLVERLELKSDDFVIEIASNDGYLLQYFRSADIRVLGVEPAAEVANIAKFERNIPTIVKFFGRDVAKEILLQYPKPKLIIANNVLAHVPDIHDFVAGFEILLDNKSIVTFEFPHLLNLIRLNQFDTIYHEHYSYLSITALNPIFAKHGLRVFDVEKLDTHGGSLRIYVCRADSDWPEEEAVKTCVLEETLLDPRLSQVSSKLQTGAQEIRSKLSRELLLLKSDGMSVAAYGAAAKGNTLLNYLGMHSRIIDYVVDRNPSKQGKFLPGSLIPIVSEEHLKAHPPDILLVLPWNLATELTQQLAYLKKQGVKFLRAIPNVEYF